MQGREVFFEFRQVGAYMRVAAIDGKTGIEAVISGPVSAPQGTLQRNALKRLEFVLKREGVLL